MNNQLTLTDGYILRQELYRLSEEGCRQAVAILGKRLIDFNDPGYYLKIPLSELRLPGRIPMVLANNNVLVVGDIVSLGYEAIRQFRGMNNSQWESSKSGLTIFWSLKIKYVV